MLGTEDLNLIDRRNWSGHNHSEFCPHGSGEAEEEYIEKAIDNGFKTYSITEHFPMPPKFYDRVTGAQHAIYTAAMSLKDLPNYLKKMKEIKIKYADRIQILIGFEFDFIESFEDWTAEQLKLYGQQIDDAILSVHFLPTRFGLRAVDESPLDFKSGILKEYGSPLGVAKAYLKTVKKAVEWETEYKPLRYGHIMLYRKWRNTFPAQTLWEDIEVENLLKNIIKEISQKSEFLDCNMAGLFRPTQTEPTPTFKWLQKAQQLNIPLVFGSDAHKVAAVDQGYNTYLENQYFL